MARSPRVQYEEGAYHVMARGNERKEIYRNEEDRALFVRTMEELVDRYGLRIFAYCLMPNHYHLVVGTPKANLSQAIGWLQTTYTIRHNRKWRRVGHLFQGRYKAQIVEMDSYAQSLLVYVHLNPVRIGVKKGEPIPAERWEELQNYPWSSHRIYAGKMTSPKWLDKGWQRYFGRNPREVSREYRRALKRAFAEGIKSPWEEMVNGLILGGEEFVERVKKILKTKSQPEEQRWLNREDQEQRKAKIIQLVKGETDRRVQIWLRVRLGLEQMVAVAKDYGYRDGAGIHQVLRRLEARRAVERDLNKKLLSYERTCKE